MIKLPVRYARNQDNYLLSSECEVEGVAGSIIDADDNFIARIWNDYEGADGDEVGQRIAEALNNSALISPGVRAALCVACLRTDTIAAQTSQERND